jgi:hypothetical protein
MTMERFCGFRLPVHLSPFRVPLIPVLSFSNRVFTQRIILINLYASYWYYRIVQLPFLRRR